MRSPFAFTAVALTALVLLPSCSRPAQQPAAAASPDASAAAAQSAGPQAAPVRTAAPDTSAPDTAAPDSAALIRAAGDAANWPLPGKTYGNNRYTALAEITPSNVARLRRAWATPLVDDGEEEASPVVWDGVMYVSTAHDNVVALDGTTGRLRWAFGYAPSYELQYAVNRGVGIAGNNVYVATQDCRLIAVDRTTGKQRWNVPACRDTTSSWYSMAAYVYKNAVVLGTSGGDLGGSGLVSGFSARDGHRLWEWHTIPQPGQPRHDSWPGNSWIHGGAAVWNGLAIDPSTDTAFVTPGNAGPNLTLAGRKGLDLYSNSLVALDISSATPRVRWYYQIVTNDTHDADPAMPPVVFDANVAGHARHLVAVGDKAGDFLIFDRRTGKLVQRIAVSVQTNLFSSVPTVKGTFACPNHGGGIEWNGGAYDPSTGLFLIPSTEECAVWKVTTNGPVPYIPGQPYSAGPLPKRRPATGTLTALDVNTGRVRWRKSLPYPPQGGVLVAPRGLAFTSDLRGRLYAFSASTGKELWHDDTGSAVVAPLSAYRAGGHEYVTVFAGEAGNQQTPNLPQSHGPLVLAYRLDAPPARVNTTAGQPHVVAAAAGQANESSGPTPSLPYTAAQVASGKSVYATSCASCHGNALQGVSAPALTGSAIGHAHLNISQLRTIVTQQMPLSAPGSLSPAQYAAVMAYIAKYDCVKAAGNGTTPFPASDQPAFKNAVLPAATCPVK